MKKTTLAFIPLIFALFAGAETANAEINVSIGAPVVTVPISPSVSCGYNGCYPSYEYAAPVYVAPLPGYYYYDGYWSHHHHHHAPPPPPRHHHHAPPPPPRHHHHAPPPGGHGGHGGPSHGGGGHHR